MEIKTTCQNSPDQNEQQLPTNAMGNNRLPCTLCRSNSFVTKNHTFRVLLRDRKKILRKFNSILTISKIITRSKYIYTCIRMHIYIYILPTLKLAAEGQLAEPLGDAREGPSSPSQHHDANVLGWRM